MIRFADVLGEIETSTPAAGSEPASVRVNTAGWDVWFAPEDPSADAAPQKASANYPIDDMMEDVASPSPVSAPVPDPTPEPVAAAPVSEAPVNLARELSAPRLRKMSIAELQALRRRLARRVHPDLCARARATDPQAMARVNVEIDAALRARRRAR